MDRSKRIALAAIVAGGAIVGATAAVASGRADRPLDGDVRRRAIAAALARTSGGAVLETEAGDDGAAYTVEVRLADGRVVEVRLDERFHAIGTEVDDGSELAGSARDD